MHIKHKNAQEYSNFTKNSFKFQLYSNVKNTKLLKDNSSKKQHSEGANAIISTGDTKE